MSLVGEWLQWRFWRYGWERWRDRWLFWQDRWGDRWQFWRRRWRRDTVAALGPGMTLEHMRQEARARLELASEIELKHTGAGAEPLTGADLERVKQLLTEADLLHDRMCAIEEAQALTEKTEQMLEYYTQPPGSEVPPPAVEAGGPEAQGVFHRGYDAGYREGWREALARAAGQLQAAAQRPAQDVRRVGALAEAYNEAEACAHPPEDGDEDAEDAGR